MRLVIIFASIMAVIIVVLLFSYNRVLLVGHERRCARIFTDPSTIEECVDYRKRGMLLENMNQNEQNRSND